MKQTKIILPLIFLILATIVPLVHAEQGHLTLLTVMESGNETTGGTADLYLEIRPGSGRVFIDSFPLTKVDTQISTRFAKEVACDYLDKDCSNKDFFYTIRAKSPIVGGPSAGAAITILTMSELTGNKLDENTVITGTINSGGIIGPVAGIKEKAEAAKEEGKTKILIPSRSILDIDKNNTTNITYADSLKIEGTDIIPISTIEEAYYEFTGIKQKDYSYNISIPEDYQKIMKSIAEGLCARYNETLLATTKELLKKNQEAYNETLKSINNSIVAMQQKDYYSAASYCFSADTTIRTIQFKGLTNESLLEIAQATNKSAKQLLDEINKKDLKTISDLETTIIVKERLYETLKLLEGNQSEILSQLGYAVERYNSALAWSTFFNYPGKELVINQEELSNACLSKIAEAEERLNYIDFLYGSEITSQKKQELSDAKKSYDEEDYTYCLFKAAKVSADANAIILSVSITKEKVPELIKDLLKQARTQINKQGQKFPILGYSYYNYANSLKEERPDLAIVFSEYSTEFSNLGMYFPKKKTLQIDFREDIFLSIIIGFLLGSFLTSRIYVKNRNKSKKSEKKHSNKLRK